MYTGFTVLYFALGMLLAQFAPGPDMILLTGTSVRDGWRRACFMVLGIASGLFVHLVLVVTGLTTLVACPDVLRWFYLASGLYLMWLAAPMWRGGKLGGVLVGPRCGEPLLSRAGAWRAGFFCNLFNPKSVLFLSSFMLGFMHPDDPIWWRPLLCAIVISQALIFWTLYIRALDGLNFRVFFQRNLFIISKLCAVILFLIAGKLLWEWIKRVWGYGL